MKVLFDNLAFEDQTFGGVTRYFSEIIRHFPPRIQVVLPVVETANEYLREVPFSVPPAKWCYQRFLPDLRYPGKHFSYRVLSRIASLFRETCEIKNAKAFRRLLRQGEFEVLHLTGAHLCGNAWMPAVGKKPVVATIHDLIPDKIQHRKRFVRERFKVVRNVTRFIAVSENTKKDFVEEYGVDPERVDVVYHGASVVASSDKGEDVRLPFNYVLFVGGRSGYKNFEFFAKALAPWLLERPGMRLVCTGKPFSSGERSLLWGLGIADRCEARFFESSNLYSLFSHAFAFVFPSTYEGFGIPILDAFAARCPVILNRVACFPEIGGDAVLYFENGNPESLVRQLSRLESESTLRRRLQDLGTARISLFSWTKAAEETADVYQRAIDSFANRR